MTITELLSDPDENRMTVASVLYRFERELNDQTKGPETVYSEYVGLRVAVSIVLATVAERYCRRARRDAEQ